MFDLGVFIKNGFLQAVGKMADYKIILNAAGWYDKGVLTDTDLAEIQSAINEKNDRIEAAEEAEKSAESAAEKENAEAAESEVKKTLEEINEDR